LFPEAKLGIRDKERPFNAETEMDEHSISKSFRLM
jgi:hypothetical protein